MCTHDRLALNEISDSIQRMSSITQPWRSVVAKSRKNVREIDTRIREELKTGGSRVPDAVKARTGIVKVLTATNDSESTTCNHEAS
jgi:hypothetical protein